MSAHTTLSATRQPFARAIAARAAADRAPRGAGLATVTALPFLEGPLAGVAPDVDPSEEWDGGASSAPVLRLVAVPARPRRRARALLTSGLAVVLLLAVGLGVSSRAAGAADAPVIAGHVVLQPGETLWDVAVRSAPAGVDPRQQLDALRTLNGFTTAALDAWTVVLIPAP